MFHEHVKEYKLAFSNDGSNFQVYQENGKEKVSLRWQSGLAFHIQSILLTVTVFRDSPFYHIFFSNAFVLDSLAKELTLYCQFNNLTSVFRRLSSY